jgi:pilus assembly protein CpaF
MHDIFEFQGRGVDAQGRVVGLLQPTGLRPHLLDRFVQFGEHIPLETFLQTASGSHSSAQAG